MRILYPYGEEFTGSRAREVHTIHRVHSLAEAGAEVDLVVATSDAFADAEALLAAFGLSPHPRLRVSFLPRRIGFGPLKFVSTAVYYRNLGRFLRREAAFDWAYAIHLKAARFLGKDFPKMKVAFEAHEVFADSFSEGTPKFTALSELERTVYGNSTAVIATSRYLLGVLRERYPLPARTAVVPNSVDARFFAAPLDGADPNRLVYAGSFQQWKGVDVAVAAMKLLPNHRLDIFGGSPEQVAAMKVSAPDNTRFHGFQNQAALAEGLARARIALIPNRLTPKSSLYSFPMKLLEYAAAGRCVVASDLPVLRELGLGEWARLVPPENPAALAKAIETFAGTAELGQAARRWAAGFTWPRQAADIMAFLRS